jgi:hypothetical protein
MLKLCSKCGRISDTVDNDVCLDCARREHCIEEAMFEKIQECHKKNDKCDL